MDEMDHLGQAPFNGSPVLASDGTIYAIAGLHSVMRSAKGDDWHSYGGLAGLYAIHPDGTAKWLYRPHLPWIGLDSNPLVSPV